MKDLFETIMGMEAQRLSTTKIKRSKIEPAYEGEILRDLLGGEAQGSINIEEEMNLRTRSSILEDFDFDRDFEEATLDTGSRILEEDDFSEE